MSHATATCRCKKERIIQPGTMVICKGCGMAYSTKTKGSGRKDHDAVDLKRALDMEPAKLKRALDNA